jgi:2-dehydropantoate 2-reductase
MKIAVIGAGAIGGLVGARLAATGCDVTFMVRGANLEAIRRQGVRVYSSDGSDVTVREVRASSDYATAGVQDVVVLAVKAHQLANVAADAARLVGPRTVVVTMQNGTRSGTSIGMAARCGHGRAQRGPARHLGALHSAGASAGLRRVSGVRAGGPGVVAHIEGDRLPLGELDGTQRARDTGFRVFRPRGFKAPSSTTSARRSGSSSGAT